MEILENNYVFSNSQKLSVFEDFSHVCFEVDIKTELVTSENACNWGMKYYSVIGFGKAHFIEDANEKKKALDVIMQKYSKGDNKSFEYSKSALDKTVLIKVEIENLTGKKSGY